MLFRKVRLTFLFVFTTHLFLVSLAISQPNAPLTVEENTLALLPLDGGNGEVRWLSEHDIYPLDTVGKGILTSDDCYVMAGWNRSGNPEQDKFIIKVNPDGELVWVQRYGDEGYENLRDIVELENGNLISVGEVDIGRRWEEEAYILMTNSDGDSLDSWTYGGRNNQSFKRVILDGDQLLLHGRGFNQGEDRINHILVRVNLEGDSLWSAAYGDYHDGSLVEIIATNDGGFLFTGTHEERDNDQDAHIIKINADGESEWETTVDNFDNDYLSEAIEVEDGFVCFGRVHTEEGGYDYWVVKINEDGEVLWENSYGDPNIRQFSRDLTLSREGNYILLGSMNQDITELIKISPEGEEIWLRQHPVGEDCDHKEVILNPDGGYTLIGTVHVPQEMNSRNVSLLRTFPDCLLNQDLIGNNRLWEILGDAAIEGNGRWNTALDLRSEEGGALCHASEESLCPETFTVETWFLMDPDVWQTGVLFSKQIEEADASIEVVLDNGFDDIVYSLTAENGEHRILVDVDVDDGEWHHLSATYNGQIMRLFIDGDLVGTEVVDSPVVYGLGSWFIGNKDEHLLDDLQFYGLIDDFRISSGTGDDITVPLNSGWNMISINVIPPENLWTREEGPDVELMMEQLIDEDGDHHLVLMKNKNGQFYMPEHNFNNIPFWDLTQGYLVNVDEDIEIYCRGELIQSDADVPLEDGWNIIAYYPTYELDASAPDFHVLSPIIDFVQFAKNGNGRFMSPEFEFSNMPPWRETQGYQVRVSQDVVLNYPEAQEEVLNFSSERLSYPQPVRSPFNMSLLINSISVIDQSNVVLTAVDLNGNPVGDGIVGEEGRSGIAVWGDDPETEFDEGLSEGEAFEIRIEGDGSKLEVAEIVSGEGLVYRTDGFAVVNTSVSTPFPENFHIESVYPNPFNSLTRIEFGLPVQSQVKIAVYDLSGRLVETLINSELPVGFHETVWDATEVVNGIYMLKMESTDFSETIKVAVIK